MAPTAVIRPVALGPIDRSFIVPVRVLFLPAIGLSPPVLGLSLQLSQAHESDGGRRYRFAFPGKEEALPAG